MKVKNRVRFITFLVSLSLCAGLIGYAIGSTAFAEEPKAFTKPMKTTTDQAVQRTETIDFVDLGVWTITGYCGCEKCCGEWSSDPVIGAGGVELVDGVHCAAPLPFGTIVDVDGIGTFEVQDRTSEWVSDKYDGKIIDIYFDTHEDAVNFTKKTAKVKKMVEVL